MKNYFLFFVFYLISISLLAQNIVKGQIVDDKNIGISYANIYINSTNKFIQTDSTGKFLVNDNFFSNSTNNDSVIISSVGYDTKMMSIETFKNYFFAKKTLTLVERTIHLPEVLIKSQRVKLRDYGYYKLKPSSLRLVSSPGNSLCVYIKNDDKTEGLIKNINFRVYSNNNKTKTFFFRLRFFTKTKDGFEINDMLKGSDVLVKEFKKKDITIDVSKYNIPFTKDGIYVGFECITNPNEIHNINEKFETAIACTSKNNEQNTWILNKKGTWGLFQKRFHNEDLKDIPKFYRNVLFRANAQIGITVY